MWVWNSKEGAGTLSPASSPRACQAKFPPVSASTTSKYVIDNVAFVCVMYENDQLASAACDCPGCLASVVSLERPSAPQTSCSQAWYWRQCIQQGAHRCLTLLLEQKCGQAITGISDKDGLTIWHLAALNRNIQALDILSSYVADAARLACQRSHKGLISLHCAAGAGSVETMVVFLNAGSSISDATGDGSTPLDFAVKSNSTEAVRFLLDKGSNPHTAIKDSSTPLHHAIIECWDSSIRDVVNLLLDKGVDPCAPRVDGRTPLHLLFDSVRDVQCWQTRFAGTKKHKDDEDTDSSLKTSILKKFVQRRAVTDHVGPNS